MLLPPILIHSTKTYTLHVGDEMPDGRLSIDGFTFVGAIEKKCHHLPLPTTQGETTSVLTTEEVTHEMGTTEVTATSDHIRSCK